MSVREESFKLLESWGSAVAAVDRPKVLSHYNCPNATLWPTLSNKLRCCESEIEDYFVSFLAKIAPGNQVSWDQNEFAAIDENNVHWSGIYTFPLKEEFGGSTTARYSYLCTKTENGWKFAHHHSSAMPEK